MSNNAIKRPRGTIDYQGEMGLLLSKMREILLDTAKSYNCQYVEVPMFEESSLFHRSVGESSDIVTKETFDLQNKGEKNYTLRPEFTASISRAVIENKLYTSPDMPLRFSYFGPVFRYERPQAGRYRQITQFGAEFIDSKIDIATSVEAFMLSIRSAEKLLGHEVSVKLNFLGSFASREIYKTELKEFFKDKIDNMCDDCKRRYQLNPLRILDCKVEEDQVIARDAPRVSDYLSDEDKKEYQEILKLISSIGVKYEIDTELVRGLDYYTGLVWELYDEENLNLGAIGGGGKYSSLMAQIGGPDFEGIGFSLGGERLLLSLDEKRKNELLSDENLDYFIIDLLKDGSASILADKLRDLNNSVSIASYSRALGGAIKMADRLKSKKVIIIDTDKTYKVKDMKNREQQEMTLEQILTEASIRLC